MKSQGIDRSEVLELVGSFKKKDISFDSGRIFGSMCTSPHPIAKEVDNMFQESNLGNPGLYPGTMDMERKVISMVGALLNLDRSFGHVLSGGTEANITALYRAKKKTGQRKVIFPRSAHFSVLKAVKLLDLEPVPIDLDEDFHLSLDLIEDALSDDVASVLCVAGSTELGTVDPIEKVAGLINGIPLHVDAAFGGFVLPFLEEMGILPTNIGRWDFRVDGVTTISVDPHKMGGSTIPAGCLLFREEYPLKYLSVKSPYLTSSKAYTLAGTRDSGAVAGAYAVMKYLGREGYRKQLSLCMENTTYLKKRLMELGLELVIDPVMNIVAVHHPDPALVQSEMESRGYYLSRVEIPSSIRFVVMPHVTKDAINNMIPHLEKVISAI